ncbi:unnamed protein product [Parnassius mnemosyne]|uniref:ISXO2-like transposase domain-containing protein n=1 Tax=Parnassius mnemosyne TaxID=213953 RepID=A0AAV1LR07_9NEOP
MCRHHRIPMRISYGNCKNVGQFICTKGNCRARSKVSRAKDTWFENVKLSMLRVYFLMYAFAHRWSYDNVIFEDPERDTEGCLSMATIADWYSYCRETVVIYQINVQKNIGKIGGPGKVVQIDESKFGKRKYNKGRHIEGHWVLGLIEDGSEDLRLEVCPENVRSAEVLVPLIQKHVIEGSIIHTDCWRAYDCLGSYGYIHKKVNHSDPDNPFVAPDGTHTQRIEAQWRVVKKYYKHNINNPKDFSDSIVEYMWRRRIQRNKKDLFLSLIEAINFVYKFK